MHNDSVIETRVIDNGSGIEEKHQQKIFTPFYTTKDSGMGLGLSICRSIIEAHQGVLRFNSQLNKGTAFYFTLPIRRETNEF
jgi:two-component system sensor kinase FixL